MTDTHQTDSSPPSEMNTHQKDTPALSTQVDLVSDEANSVARASVAYPHEVYELADALYKTGLFTLTQGAYQDQSALALTYVSRFYQALSLWPTEFTERLNQQARQLVPSERVQLGLSIASQLKPLLGPTIVESSLRVFSFYYRNAGHTWRPPLNTLKRFQ